MFTYYRVITDLETGFATQTGGKLWFIEPRHIKGSGGNEEKYHLNFLRRLRENAQGFFVIRRLRTRKQFLPYICRGKLIKIEVFLTEEKL